MPLWLAVGMGAVFNLMWMSYDYVFKPLFGDGERTEEPAGGDGVQVKGGKGVGEEEPLLVYK